MHSKTIFKNEISFIGMDFNNKMSIRVLCYKLWSVYTLDSDTVNKYNI